METVPRTVRAGRFSLRQLYSARLFLVMVATLLVSTLGIPAQTASALAGAPSADSVVSRLAGVFGGKIEESSIRYMAQTGAGRVYYNPSFKVSFKAGPGLSVPQWGGLALAAGLAVTYTWLSSEVNREPELAPTVTSMRDYMVGIRDAATERLVVSGTFYCSGPSGTQPGLRESVQLKPSGGTPGPWNNVWNHDAGNFQSLGNNVFSFSYDSFATPGRFGTITPPNWGGTIGYADLAIVSITCGRTLNSPVAGNFYLQNGNLDPQKRQNQDPVRRMQVDGECVDSKGNITKAKTSFSAPYTHSQNLATGVEVPPVNCPEFQTPTSIEVTEIAPGGEVGPKTIFKTPKTDEMPNLADTADPCSAVFGWICENIPQKKAAGSDTWLQCGTQTACPTPKQDLQPGPDTDTRQDPDGNTYRCHNGKRVTSWASCDPTFDDDITKNPNPTEQPNPNNQPRPTPPPLNTPAPPAPGFNPEPPVTNLWQCAPSGWQILNPVAYVYGMGCVFTWAFVPQNAPDLAVELGGLIKDRVPFSWITSTIAWWGGIGGATCDTACFNRYSDWGWDIKLANEGTWTVRPFAFSAGPGSADCSTTESPGKSTNTQCLNPQTGTSAWLLQQTRPWVAGLTIASSVVPVIYYISRKIIPFLQL